MTENREIPADLVLLVSNGHVKQMSFIHARNEQVRDGLQVERFFQEMKMNLNVGARCCTVEQPEASPGSIYGQNSSSFYHSLSLCQ